MYIYLHVHNRPSINIIYLNEEMLHFLVCYLRVAQGAVLVMPLDTSLPPPPFSHPVSYKQTYRKLFTRLLAPFSLPCFL